MIKLIVCTLNDVLELSVPEKHTIRYDEETRTMWIVVEHNTEDDFTRGVIHDIRYWYLEGIG